MRTMTFFSGIGVAVALCLAGPAWAQDALGGGNVLDSNLGQMTGGRNFPNPALNFQARNLLVTDDVVDGRGFRGTVGYTAARDFRAPTGFDSLDAFKQLTALSNPQVILTGSSYAQMRYTQAVADLNFMRTYASPGIEQWMANDAQAGTGALRNTRILVDRLTLGQTLAMQQAREAEAHVLGTMMDGTGQSSVIRSSELTGISFSPRLPAIDRLGLSSYDKVRLVADSAAGMDISDVGQGFDSTFSNLLVQGNRIDETSVDQRIQGTSTEALIEPVMASDYQKVLERIAERYAEAENVDLQVEQQLLSQLDAEFESLRQQLDQEPASEQDSQERRLGDFERSVENVEDPTPRDDEPEKDSRIVRPIEDFGIVLRHGERVATLTSEDDTRFNELMRAGEQFLRKGDYFWAERRFEHALRFHPGQPLATAGLGHSQLGAGLYLPASYTLRNLLQRQPEMIDINYESVLLPNRASLNRAIQTLRERLGGSDRNPQDVASDGFLLAYIGHQIDEPALVDEGLGYVTKAQPQDPMTPLLLDLWGQGSGDEQ